MLLCVAVLFAGAFIYNRVSKKEQPVVFERPAISAPIKDPTKPSSERLSGLPDDTPLYEQGTLLGIFESEEEAQKTAELYGITLSSFDGSLAVFKCEGDPAALIEQGKENNWPELSLNYILRAY
jgi:hypothetical protein